MGKSKDIEKGSHLSESLKQSPHILIVEDETLVSWALASTLKKSGFNISVVDSGEKAIELISSNRFDLVITDLKLPHIDGLQVAMEVKLRCSSTPVIMMSAQNDQTIRELNPIILIDHFVEKPFNVNEVITIATKLIKDVQYHPPQELA